MKRTSLRLISITVTTHHGSLKQTFENPFQHQFSLIFMLVFLKISPVNNNISKSAGFPPAGPPSPPPVPPVTISTQSHMGSSSFSQTATAPIGHTSSSFTTPTSFPRQQFPSSGMYGWY